MTGRRQSMLKPPGPSGPRRFVLFYLFEHRSGCGGLLLRGVLPCGVFLYCESDAETYRNKQREAEKEARERAEGAGLHGIIVYPMR